MQQPALLTSTCSSCSHLKYSPNEVRGHPSPLHSNFHFIFAGRSRGGCFVQNSFVPSRGISPRLATDGRRPASKPIQLVRPEVRREKTGYTAPLYFPGAERVSLAAKHLATQLHSRLNPKRGAAAPVNGHPSPNAPAAPRSRIYTFGGDNRRSRETLYGFACRSYKQQLELDLRYT